MTDEQFQQLMQAQMAQLTLLQGCYALIEAAARKQGVVGAHYNWQEAHKFFNDALAQINPEEYARQRGQKP